jgi:uncharacterized protein (TIGR03032 family)
VTYRREAIEYQYPNGLFQTRPYYFEPSNDFIGWLASNHAGVALTAGENLITVGCGVDGSLFSSDQKMEKPRGIAVHDRSLYVTTDWQIIRFVDALPRGSADEVGRDRRYIERETFVTGAMDALDIAVTSGGKLYFTGAFCNCIATISARACFLPVWIPPFVSELVWEDRCHLTGLALDGDVPAYVTCASTADTAGGWKAHVSDGGVVVDVASGVTLAEGLALPCSPRIHGNTVLVACGGSGEVVAVDRSDGSVEVITCVPGMARSIALLGNYALIGVARKPEFDRYADEVRRLSYEGDGAFQGIIVVNLTTGAVEHRLAMHGDDGTLSGLAVLPNCVRPDVSNSVGDPHELLLVG